MSSLKALFKVGTNVLDTYKTHDSLAQSRTFFKNELNHNVDFIEIAEVIKSHDEGALIKLTVKDGTVLPYKDKFNLLWLWLFPAGELSDDIGSLILYHTSDFSFGNSIKFKKAKGYRTEYKLMANAPDILHTKNAFKDAWVCFCDQVGYTPHDSFLTPITAKSKPEKDFNEFLNHCSGKSLTFNTDLNLIHRWNTKELLAEYHLDFFADLVDEDDNFLLANEQPNGMLFSMLKEISTEALPDYITKIIDFEWIAFSSSYDFGNVEFPNSSAFISAGVKFVGQSVILETVLPTSTSGDSGISLDIKCDIKFGTFLTTFDPDLDLPEILNSLPLKLKYINLHLGNDSINSFTAHVSSSSTNGWEVVPDLFTLYNTDLVINWQRGVGFSFQAAAGMNALSYDFNISYAYPAQFINAELMPGETTSKSIKSLATEVGFPDAVAEGLSAVGTAFDLSMSADLHYKQLGLRLQNHEEWVFKSYLTVETFDLNIEFFNQWKFSGASLFTGLSLPIGKKVSGVRKSVHIDIWADYEKENNFWSFEGSTGPGEEIPVGEAFDTLLTKINGDPADGLPEAIRSLSVLNLSLAFDNKGNADFVCQTVIEVQGKEVNFWVRLKRDEEGNLTFVGTIFMNGIQLAVAFSKESTQKNILGSLILPLKMDARDIVSAIAPDLLDSIPINVEIILEGLLIGMNMTVGEEKKFIFRLAFKILFDLSGFPLIGGMLKNLQFTDGQLVVANKDWKNENIDSLNGLLGEIQPETPKPIKKSPSSDSEMAIGSGISVGGSFHFSDSLPEIPLYLEFGKKKELPAKTDAQDQSSGGAKPTKSSGGQPSAGSSSAGSSSDVKVKPGTQARSKPSTRSQGKVNKVFSAVKLKKVGLVFQNGRLGLKLTGGLSLAAFEFELIGMQVTVPQSILNNPSDVSDTEFGLDGFGANIRKGPMAITAGFLRTHYPSANGIAAYDEFNGVVQIQLTKLSLAGLGSYAKYDGHHSLFLFVALGFPIPLHPSLLITGLSFGFGIHRDAVMPKMAEVMTYPLVQMSVTPPPPIEIATLVTSMHHYFPPTVGQYFVVAGVKFKAFSLVENLVMLIVKFGREFEINLIGVSNILFPSLFIELAWMARFVPKEGYLLLQGQLTDRSYLLVPEVQLTGGFAVAAWAHGDHEGDFIVSVGGYHPQFKVPAHYPNHIPRLGISFDLEPISVKGGIYFAITPKFLMLGAELEASFDGGWIEAYLKIQMDALICFEPFHYDLMLEIDAGVKATIGKGWFSFTLDLHLHLDCHIWGPDFSGTASVDVGPKTFELEFGEGGSNRAIPITYTKFKEKFLQNGQSVYSLSLTKGLLQKKKRPDNSELLVVDPKHLEIEARSLSPVTDGNPNSDIGIAPMDVGGSKLRVSLEDFTIQEKVETNGTVSWKSSAINWLSIPLTDTLPKGIWGAQGVNQSDMNGEQLIENVKTGVKLTAPADRSTKLTQAIGKENLLNNFDEFDLLDKLSDKSMSISAAAIGGAPESKPKPENVFGAFTGVKKEELIAIDEHKLLHRDLVEYDLV